VIDGFVDRRSISVSATSRDLAYSGRDKSAALVDCSVELDHWTFRDATVFDVAKKVAEPFGIRVSIQAGIELLKAPRKLVVSPGDAAFSVISKAAEASGVLVVSDGKGGLLLTRSGANRATPLIEGKNIIAASVDFDGTDRFHRYAVVSQVGGTDESPGGATRVKAQATDQGVRRTDRVLLIRPESGLTTAYARQRADWEARIRAARSETANVTVLGWKQPNGELWPVNALVKVTCHSIGIDGEMLISQVTHSIGDSGELTQLRLVRPDAFTPEPQAVVRSTGLWKEIAKGGL
jgi:prophage tail gpP-like protein